MPVVVGSPAVHARQLRSRARAVWLLQAGVLVFLAGAGLAAFSRGWVPAAAVTGVLAVAVLALLSATRARLGQLSAGIGAEDRTARALGSSRAVIVLHGAQVGPGDVDHVVLGPVAWAVETKYGRGELRLRGGDGVEIGGRVLRGDPLGQARRNADLVAARLGVAVTPVLAISDGSFRAFWHAGVLLCPSRDLPSMVASSAPVVRVSEVDAGRFAAQLGLGA